MDKDRPRIGFLGLHGGVLPKLQELAQAEPIDVIGIGEDGGALATADVAALRLLVVQHLGPDAGSRLRGALEAAWAAGSPVRAVSLAGNGVDLFAADAERRIETDDALSAYYRAGSAENLRRMLAHIRARYLGEATEVLPPVIAEQVGLFHPAHDGRFADREGFERWRAETRPAIAAAPLVAVVAHALHLEFQQPAVVRALVEALEARGLGAVAVVDAGEGSREYGRYRSLMRGLAPALVVHTCHSRDTVELREELGVPHAHSIFQHRQSIDDWLADPMGIDAQTMAFHMVGQELLGQVEPIVTAGVETVGSGEGYVPIAGRVELLADRVARWVRLGRTAPADKKVALIYYNRSMGQAELMRGTPTGMHLNAPQSALALVAAMAERGYRITDAPRDVGELVERMQTGGRQIGNWDPDGLARLVAEGDPALIPVARYREWLERRVPAWRRAELEARWGPAPGEFMVWRDAAGEAFLVVPRLDFGGVVMLPQPLRGEAFDPSSIHDRIVPPPHHYLAAYFWLQEEADVDALIHFGTHGTEFMLPGKMNGSGPGDWPEIVIGALPNLNPWILDNVGEATPVKRRVMGVTIGFLPPPLSNAGLSDELAMLHADIDKWAGLGVGALREEFEKQIDRQVRESGLARDLGLELSDGAVLDDATIERVDAYLHEISEFAVPLKMHVLGEARSDAELPGEIVRALRQGFVDRVAAILPPERTAVAGHAHTGTEARDAAEELVRLVAVRALSPRDALTMLGVPADAAIPAELQADLEYAIDLAGRYRDAAGELTAILDALDGRYIPPGPVGAPTRNPAAVPGGRNVYAANPDEIPTRASFELGKRLAEDLLADHVQAHGRLPTKVGFDLSAFGAFHDYGVMEGQILHLIGVEPIWDRRGLVEEVRVVPAAELGRPRVDVFLSALSYYAEYLPSRMRLLDRAIRAVAALDEPDNGVRAGTARAERELLAHGVDAARAAILAGGRIFGREPGGMGNASYYYLVERSGEWDTRDDLMRAYLAQVQNVYTEGAWGEFAPQAYRASIQGTEVVTRNWNDPVTSPLSNKYTWYKAGSLSLAVKYLTGTEPELRLADVRDPERARMVDAEAALRTDLRARLFNERWIEGIRAEGYAGADMMAHYVGNVLGWKIMRDGSIDDATFAEIKRVYVDDGLDLGLPEWFDATNPHAFQELTEVLLEAIRKGFWRADAATTAELAESWQRTVERHGDNGSLRGGGNRRMQTFVAQALAAIAAEAAPLATAPAAAVPAPAEAAAEATATPSDTATAEAAAAADAAPTEPHADGTEAVRGRALAPSAAGDPQFRWLVWGLAAACAILFLLGFLRRNP